MLVRHDSSFLKADWLFPVPTFSLKYTEMFPKDLIPNLPRILHSENWAKVHTDLDFSLSTVTKLSSPILQQFHVFLVQLLTVCVVVEIFPIALDFLGGLNSWANIPNSNPNPQVMV